MNTSIPQGVRNRAKDTYFRLTPVVRDKLLESKLTAAEWRIWSYLVSLDPFGDRGAKFSPAELMLKCAVKKSTYFAAKAKFQKLGLFDFSDGVTKVFNLQGFLNHSEISECSQQEPLIESEISESHSKISEFESKISEFESKISESHSKISEFQSSKPLPEKNYGSPQTLQTYTDFIQTLSEGERENFLNFVKEQIKNLPKQVNDIEAWLANQNQAGQNRWEVYYNNFLASRKVKNESVSKYQSLAEEIEQHRQNVKKKLREAASSNSPSDVQDSCTSKENEQNSSHSRHSDIQKEISRRREEEAKKYWLEKRREIDRKRFEQGGES
jgi:hypothetical protein